MFKTCFNFVICTIFDNILLFRNFLSIPFDTKIKWSFGANSREENKFSNLDYLAGTITWIKMLNTWQISISTFSDAHWIIKFSVRHKNNKKTSPFAEGETSTELFNRNIIFSRIIVYKTETVMKKKPLKKFFEWIYLCR